MTNLRHLLWIVLFLLFALLALFPFLVRQKSNPGLIVQNARTAKPKQSPQAAPAVPAASADILLRNLGQAPPDPATSEYKFEILNNGPSTAVFPDTWFLLFDDGSLTNLSLPQTGNIRVDPGQKGTIAIARPVKTNSWRLVGNYYLEDSLFRVKVAIDRSALKSHLPDSASSVQGKNVQSDWIK